MKKERGMKHIIDCDAYPYCPDGWCVLEHHEIGQLEWKKDAGVDFNANVLDYLLAHPEIIPKEWEDKLIPFRETIYIDSFGNKVIRSLCGNSVAWGWDSIYI